MSWIKLSLFSRGAIAAITLLAAADYALPAYSPLDVVSGVHAAVVGWNELAASLGTSLSYLFGLPNIPAEIVNAAIIGGAIGPAWTLSILKAEWGQHQGMVQNLAFWTRAILGFVEVFFMAIFAISAPPFSIIFFFALLGLLVPLITALNRLSAYRNGFVSTLAFLAVLEGIYLISTDRVQSAFDVFVCERQQASAPRCEVSTDSKKP